MKSFVAETWLIGRREVRELLGWYALLVAVWCCVGFLMTGLLQESFILRADYSIATWFAERRTPTLNSLTYIGSMLSDTFVKIAATAVVAGTMLVIWKRWLEALVVAVSLVLEALCFITITIIVGRDRPGVAQLDSSPVGSSYPSGHVAAAVAYSAIVVVIFWRTRARWIRIGAVAAVAFVSVCVAVSRMYRGMHFFTDVVFGALLGLASVFVTAKVLRRAATYHDQPATADRTEVATEPVRGIVA